MLVVFENLEGRRLLSGATFQEGIVRVRGDDDVSDTIVLRLNPTATIVRVELNGQIIESFARDQIQRITVNGKGDDDTLEIDEVNGRLSGFKIELYGGEGNDVIRGGSDKLKAFGQGGDDSMFNVCGYIDGGAGNDHIEASRRKDYIFGGEGNDFIDGEEGNDVIWGGAGDDLLEGDEGNDIIFGEAGDDTITGGLGDDRLFGNLNIDLIRGEDGDDSLYGGRHEDVLEGGLGGSDIRTYGEYSKIESLMSSQLAKATAYV